MNTLSMHRSSIDMQSSTPGSSTSQTQTANCGLLILTVAFVVLSAVDTTTANELSPITKLQDKFRKLGGTVVPIEGKFGSDYRFPGRPTAPLDVAEILRTLREVHLVSIVSEPDDLHLVSALSANRAGRDLLQFERHQTSLLHTAMRRRVNSALRDFYDAEIDLGWLFIDEDSDLKILDNMFRAAELSRARDFLGSVYHRVGYPTG